MFVVLEVADPVKKFERIIFRFPLSLYPKWGYNDYHIDKIITIDKLSEERRMGAE